jgi:hypothetical protein
MTFQGDYTVVLGFGTCAGLGFPQRSVTQARENDQQLNLQQ